MGKILFILILFLQINNSFAQIKIGRINDADGYVNIRKEPNNKARILNKIHENEPFEYIENETDWWWVTKLDGKKGFIHKSRIKEEYEGIVFKNKAYGIEKYCIKTEKIYWNDLFIIVVKICPREDTNIEDMDYSRDIIQCSAQIRVYLNNSEIDRLEYFNIDAVGGSANVGFPKKQVSDKFLFGCKYGDYDGRLIQIDSSGRINTYPGGNYFITQDRKYLVTIWDSDITGITVVDMNSGMEYYKKEIGDGLYLQNWYEHDGEYYTYQFEYNAEGFEDHSKITKPVFKLNITNKKLQQLKVDYKQVKKFIKLEVYDEYSHKPFYCEH